MKPLETFKGIRSQTDPLWHVLGQIWAPEGHYRADTMCGFGGGPLKHTAIVDVPLLAKDICPYCLLGCLEESASMRAHWPFRMVVEAVLWLKRRGKM
jgi:hypothetical protein